MPTKPLYQSPMLLLFKNKPISYLTIVYQLNLRGVHTCSGNLLKPEVLPATFTLTMCLTRPPPVLSKTVPLLPKSKWSSMDAELNTLQASLFNIMGHDIITTSEAMEKYGELLSEFLASKPEFQEEVREFYEHAEPKSVAEAKKAKNCLRKKAMSKDATDDERDRFRKALKIYNFLLKKQKEKTKAGKIKKHENMYKKNFFKFAKAASAGRLDEESPGPTFTKEEADTYYQGRYSNPKVINLDHLDWFPETAQSATAFNTDHITPGMVKGVLCGKSPQSAPGVDGLLYGVLAKLPSVHWFLATHYTKTLQSCLAPQTWASSKLILCHKDGDTGQPSNFRPLALSSCLGKPFHQIKAHRLADYMVANGFINTSTQKAFLQGINGCTEHIKVLQEIIQDAKSTKKTVHFSWFDLTDAFGSIAHNLIEHCLRHYQVPETEICYIMDLYSKLEGKVTTKEWISEVFQFCKGIFQGDPYSPIIFLVVFQPLLDFILQKKEALGYKLGNHKVITLPFADDFELITNHKTRHQKLVCEVQAKAETMGLEFKPSKCRSLSIERGKVKTAAFYLNTRNGGQVVMKGMEDDP